MESRPELRRGDEVHRVGNPADSGVIIDGPRTVSGAVKHHVSWGNGRKFWVDSVVLEKIEPEPLTWVPRDDFLADLVLQKFFYGFSDVLFSIGSSDTEFLVYQFKPVLQFVRQMSHGLLIADEVGLGKTIEAALILRELMARGHVERVLVVCPANLRKKWRSELENRFGIRLEEMRRQQFSEMKDQFERDGEWPAFFGVASLEGLRVAEYEETLVETGVQFDLVVVDEAHHLRNPTTRSFDLGRVLSDQSDHILLLSATPLQTGQTDLLSLLQLADPAEFGSMPHFELDTLLAPNRYINRALSRLARPEPDLAEIADEMGRVLSTPHGASFARNSMYTSWQRQLENVLELTPETTVELRRHLHGVHTLAPYYTRTRKREVAETAERVARVVPVPLTPIEQEFYDAWVDFLVERARFLNPNVPPGWRINTYERLAASSLPAARERLDDLIADVEIGDDYEGTDSELADDSPAELWPGWRPERLDLAVGRVRQAAVALSDEDTKLKEFIDLINDLIADRPQRKILVFTFFKATLRHVTARLRGAGIGHESIWGDDPPEQRSGIIERFKDDPHLRVLVSTEVGSEGLDFQFCDAVVNYDLPWNPMRVEQRIGRIDRFGQRESQVVVASFFAKETIDTRILDRLYERIGVFEQSIGELEPILGPEISELQADAFTRGLTVEEQRRRANDAVLRIVQRKKEMEEFESARAELMGQGDLLNQEIEDIRQSGRYVSPAETKAIVQRWLNTASDRRGSLKPTPRDSVFDLEMSDGDVLLVRNYMHDHSMSHPDTVRLLRRMHADKHAWVTFDGEIAKAYDRLPFLHIGHPIVRTALDRMQRENLPNWIARVSCFALPETVASDRIRSGVALAVYALEMAGHEPTATILPIAMDIATEEARKDLDDLLLGALADAPPLEPPAWLDDEVVRRIEDETFGLAEVRRRTVEDLQRGQSVDRIEVRKATLLRTYETRIETARQRLSQATNDRIIGMHTGRIRNLQAERDQRIAELDAAPQPSAGLELMSMAIFLPRGLGTTPGSTRP